MVCTQEFLTTKISFERAARAPCSGNYPRVSEVCCVFPWTGRIVASSLLPFLPSYQTLDQPRNSVLSVQYFGFAGISWLLYAILTCKSYPITSYLTRIPFVEYQTKPHSAFIKDHVLTAMRNNRVCFNFKIWKLKQTVLCGSLTSLSDRRIFGCQQTSIRHKCPDSIC